MERVLYNPLSVYPTVHLLSRKEREVLVLIAMGMNSKEIAIVLDVLPKSIDNYKNRITKKLGVQGYGVLGHFVSENRVVILEMSLFLFSQPAKNTRKSDTILKIRNLPRKEMENISGGGNRGAKYYH